MWSSGGAQKLPVADLPNLVDAINRKLADRDKIVLADLQQRLGEKGRENDAHLNLSKFLEVVAGSSAPPPPSSAADREIQENASAYLALLPGQIGDSLLAQVISTHGRSKTLSLLRSMTIPPPLLRDALVPPHSPAAHNYVKLVVIAAGITDPSPNEAAVQKAMEAAGLFSAAARFTAAAVASGYNDDLSLPSGFESPGLAMALLPAEALALMDGIALDDDVLDKMGVDKLDEMMVTGVKFMMVDTGMDEDTVKLITEEGVGGMAEEDINQMFPDMVWDETTRRYIYPPNASNPTSIEKVAVNPSRSFFVPARYRPIDLSAQRPAASKTFRNKKHALINSRNTSAVPRATDVELLSLFIDPFGKIRGRRYTKATAKRQKKLAKAVKCARLAGLLPFTTGPGLLGVTENSSKGEGVVGGSKGGFNPKY